MRSARNVKLALLGKSTLRYSAWGNFDQDRTLNERAVQVLETVGLAHKGRLPLEQTSYGVKRRLEIAMALAQKPLGAVVGRALRGAGAANCA